MYSGPKNIKSLSEDDRPREKLLLKGPTALSNAELLAIILGSGSKKWNAVELSRYILESCDNNLHNLARLNVDEFKKFDGIGEAKAVSVVAAMELTRRKANQSGNEIKKITTSQDAYNIIKPNLIDLNTEEAWAIFLNRANHVIKVEAFSKGGVAGTIIDKRVVLKKAIDLLASGIILCHNHPSGNLTPSQQDIKITKEFVNAGNLLDVNVLDHLIIAKTGYTSLADEGLLS